MCGIFASLSVPDHVHPDAGTLHLLRDRGPDSSRTLEEKIAGQPPLHATFHSTVLALRGPEIVSQPLIDETSGSVLCWNGEAWQIDHKPVHGNDSDAVFALLLAASAEEPGSSDHSAMIHAISLIRGPYAFVFYDAHRKRLFFGRDCLGRRSLLQTTNASGALILSSICDKAVSASWAEVEADGVYVVDLAKFGGSSSVTRIPYVYPNDHHPSQDRLILPYSRLNRATPEAPQSALDLRSPSVEALQTHLRQSLELRLQSRPLPDHDGRSQPQSRIAVLFSGGLDCTVLARIAHEVLPRDAPIDLLNVAFENPRITQARNGAADENYSPYEVCPDRATGRSSYAELCAVCPGRLWRFVEINIPFSETMAHRTKVISLMHPHATEMDLSISYALYFAARGAGLVSGIEYTSPARVLLSGLGADELFGGYQRHATAFSRSGFDGLIRELDLDIGRLGKRNLGRDDRVISNWGKEARFPYLDESLLAWALDAPVREKCGFGQEPSSDESSAIEPGKKVLRLMAWKMGMKQLAVEKKRAIQFGARTAKMETGKSKGTHLIV